jgi:hypothetical protein
MLRLNRGDCEHCHRNYNYELWHAGFGDFTYAYCDTCGLVATLDEKSGLVAQLPKVPLQCQEMDAKWEPYLRPCACGGRFRRGASPRCPYCRQPLSANYAGTHIRQNLPVVPKGWEWQGNWSDVYCLAIEDPKQPGVLRSVSDPLIDPQSSGTENTSGSPLGLNK